MGPEKVAKFIHKYVIILEISIMVFLLYLFSQAIIHIDLWNLSLTYIITVLLLVVILFSLYIDELETLLEERENK